MTKEEIMDDFTSDMMKGSGDITSELGDKTNINKFIKALNVINAQNNPDVSLKINILDALWEALEVMAEKDDIKKINEIIVDMSPYRKQYAKIIRKGLSPKPKIMDGLIFHTKKYALALRREAHKQLNKKEENKHG